MSHVRLVCAECPAIREDNALALQCARCGGPLDVEYDDAERHAIRRAGFDVPMPFHDDSPRVTLGEGDTPIARLPKIGDSLDFPNLYAKLEFMNPTGSFKDRGTAVMLSALAELGAVEIVEDSSGNAGASVAAYSARAGMRAHVFAPQTAPEAKLGQIRVYDAVTHATPGPREASTAAAVEYQRENGLVYASHNLSPYFVEGTKIFAYEVAAQMPTPPDHIVIPVGNGSLLLGCLKGYGELLSRGAVESMPRLHAVQAEAVMPIAAEFEGKTWTPGGATIAGGISVGAPPRKNQVLRAVADSGGSALAVPDESIVAWQKRLASSEGIFAEPTSAAALAGLEALLNRGVIRPTDTVLLPITGFGLKDAMPA